MEKADLVHARVEKLKKSPLLTARLELADRICMQAMRTGEFDIARTQLVGAFEPWGVYIRDVKRALDRSATAKGATKIIPPALPARIDDDLLPAIRHFAAKAGLSLPNS